MLDANHGDVPRIAYLAVAGLEAVMWISTGYAAASAVKRTGRLLGLSVMILPLLAGYYIRGGKKDES